ncbi:hypothetical protein GX50_08279 [[Emmonsia] crescens]|uniref:Zn(2)-C6 fungal-type domain-containing protein n=1 Tax=[Emmonsia] crescens TaxID=73230 RepID=A0A2B7Z834_9EURO|nr:hypothetical protein GX50_08279 [Emmonsia crescens]
MDQEERHGGTKRKRVSKACDRCRSKKYRCDGLRPACLACQESGHDCSYDPIAKKRGLPEGYVRGLEKLWALSISNIEGLEEVVLEMLGPKEIELSRRKRLFSLWNSEGASEKLHETWKSSELYANVEELLSNPASTAIGPSCIEEDGGRIEAEDSVSDIASDSPLDDFSDYRIGEFPPWALTRTRYTAPPSPGADVKRIRLSAMNQAAEKESGMELPVQTPHLLDMYFAHTQSWFPIIAKHEILRASYQYSNTAFQMGRNLAGSGNHAALWAILSYTTAQILPGTEVNSTALTRFNNSHEEAKGFYAVARSLIPDEKGKFEIGHVQAFLLLTLVNIGCRDWTAAWILCGQATSVAIDLGLGTQTRGTQRSRCSKEEETFLGCFLLDTLLSARLARSPRMRSDSIQNVNLLEEDGLEEWSPWVDVFLIRKLQEGGNAPPRGPLRSCSTFNRLIELSKLLNMLSDRDPLAPDAAAIVHESFLRDLKDWETKLPHGHRLSDVSKKIFSGESSSLLLPHQIFLLWTQMAILILHSARCLHHDWPLSYSLHQVMDITLSLLNSHAENFTQICLPPIFEFSLRTIVDAARLHSLSQSQDTAVPSLWLESVTNQISRIGGIWPVYTSLIEDMRQNASAAQLPSSRILDLDSSRRHRVSLYARLSSSPSESMYDILDSLESFLWEDTDTEQPANEEYLSFFSFLPQAPKDQFSDSDCKNNSEPFILHSPQDVDDDGWAGLQSLAPAATRQIPSTTPSLSRARAGETTSPPPPGRTSCMPTVNRKEGINYRPQLINDGYTCGQQKTTPPFPNHKTPSPAIAPAPNDIDSIFHDLPTPNNSETCNPKPHKASTTHTHNDNSSHVQLIIDICDDKSFEDALLNNHDDDNSKVDGAHEFRKKEKAEGKGKQRLFSPIMRPLSIADIWPPPGFFPDVFGEEGGKGG